MKQTIVAIFIGGTIILGNTFGEFGRSEVDSFDEIFKTQVSPLFLLDRNSSFYHLYSMKEDFPYIANRKIGHFLFYGFIAISLFKVGKRRKLLLNGFLATILAISIGILDEVYQYFLIGRSGRMLDVLIDGAGSCIFVVIYLVFTGLARHRDRSAVPFKERGT